MNPDTNKFERLQEILEDDPQGTMAVVKAELENRTAQLLRANGEPVPKHWSIFRVGEHVVLKDYTFKIAYMNDGTLILEPVAPVIVGESGGER